MDSRQFKYMKHLKLSKTDSKEKSSFEAFDNAKLTQQGRKLLKEWKKIDKLCYKNEVISYIIRNRNREGLPVEYEIIYRLKSIVGVEEVPDNDVSKEGTTEKTYRKPIYGNEHRLSIILPNNYPSALGGNPDFKMISDTWHPNIRANGKFKGRICLNNKDLGVAVGLDERILRVGKYLQFQIYWANDSYPWPEDKTVAEWIREEAEPMGWVNVDEGIFTDHKKLFARETDDSTFNESEFKKPDSSKITIKSSLQEEKISDEPEIAKPDLSDRRVESLEKKVLRLEKILGGTQKEKSVTEKPKEEKDESIFTVTGKKELRLEKVNKEDKLKQEQIEKERLEAERKERERIEMERKEKEQLEKERLEKERIERERIENERLEAERKEMERREKEQLEKERQDQQKKEEQKSEIINNEKQDIRERMGLRKKKKIIIR